MAMLPSLRRCLTLLAVVSTSLTPAVAPAQCCLAGTAADEFTADRVGLVREWIVQIPFVASGWSLEQVVIGNGLVVAQSSDGTVHAIQSAPFGGKPSPTAVGLVPGTPLPGSLLWSQRVGGIGGPSTPAGIGSDLVTVGRGRDLYGLERSTGLPRWHRPLGQSLLSGQGVIDTWVYAPSPDRTVIRFPTNPLRQPSLAADSTEAGPKTAKQKSGKAVAAKGKKKRKRAESLDPLAITGGGRAVGMAPVQLAEGVLWCTSDGLLVALEPTELEWRRREFSLENPPAGPPVVRDRSIFAATATGDLARIDLPDSLKELRLIWHTALPGPPASGPFLEDDVIVISLGELGIAAYSAETGTQLWQTCMIGSIRAVGGGRIWCIDEVGRLTSLDTADGSRREMLCLGPFTLPVVNELSDRLLLASPSGMLVSLAPRGGTATAKAAAATAKAAAAVTDPAAPARGPSDAVATPRP